MVAFLSTSQIYSDVVDNFFKTNGLVLEQVLYQYIPTACGTGLAAMAAYYGYDHYQEFTKIQVAQLLKYSKNCEADKVLEIMHDYHFTLMDELKGADSKEFNNVQNKVMANFYACYAKKEKKSLLNTRSISDADHKNVEKIQSSFNGMRRFSNKS